MEDKYTQLSIAQYSQKLARQLSDTFFTGTETVNGQQLIGFTPVKQINLFVIKELLAQWNREMANLKSPYFDFESEDVKNALKSFMNVLSRKILIKRSNFEPLLQKAIQDTFTLVINPAESFNEKFLQAQEEATGAKLQEQVKYLDLNKELISGFLETLPAGTIDKTATLAKFRLYLQAHYKEQTSVASLLEMLNPMLPIRKEDILDKPAVAQAPSTFAAAMPTVSTPDAPLKPAPVPSSGPVGPEAFPKPEPVVEKPIAEKPVPQPVPEKQAPVESTPAPKPAPAPQPAPTPVAAPSMEASPVSTATQTQGPEVKLYEKFKAEKPNLNETLKKPEAPTLGDKDTRKIESLKESISINQRFSFINELFNGENLEYYEAIQKLDSFPDAASAKNFLLEDLATQHNWVKKEEHINKLLRLIERKFATV